MCRKGGFRLHKFVSNSKEVIRRIPEQDRADGVKHSASSGVLSLTASSSLSYYKISHALDGVYSPL